MTKLDLKCKHFILMILQLCKNFQVAGRNTYFSIITKSNYITSLNFSK